MKNYKVCLFFSFIFFCMVLKVTSTFPRHFYTAAVFEHSRLGNASSDSSEDIIASNLAYYKKAAAVAKTKGADIIVFSEGGIFPFGDRQELKKYLENTPNPRQIHTNPCNEKDAYSKRPILHTLSCIAKLNNIVVVANTGDTQPCDEQPDCPSDGSFHFNTNVAFDKNGTLLARYHKEHLFFEFGHDLAREQQDPTFETDFGTFAMFICFDVVFKRITDVAQWPEVDAVLLPTMWIDPAPFMTSVQLWQSWSMGNNVTFIAANTQMPGHFAVGSGIFNGHQGPLVYTYNPDGVSKLIVANVPKSGPVMPNSSISVITLDGYEEWKNDGKDVPEQCSRKILGESKNVYKDYRCLEENTANYTFVKLNKTNDYVEVCNNGMCCSLNYSSNGIQENFYFGAYNGTYNMFDRYFWCIENCLLVRCEANGGNPCATFPMRSDTLFYNVYMRANFTTEHVYPSVLNSGMRLVPTKDWTYRNLQDTSYEASIDFQNDLGKNLIVVGFNGRCYARDPPYKR